LGHSGRTGHGIAEWQAHRPTGDTGATGAGLQAVENPALSCTASLIDGFPPVTDDPSIHQLDTAPASARQARIVGDYQYRAAVFTVDAAKQLEHAFRRAGIEIAGG